jgi:hypothetical protein
MVVIPVDALLAFEGSAMFYLADDEIELRLGQAQLVRQVRGEVAAFLTQRCGKHE